MSDKVKRIKMMLRVFVEECNEVTPYYNDLLEMYSSLDSMRLELHLEAFNWVRMNKYWPLVSIRVSNYSSQKDKFNKLFSKVLNSDTIIKHRLSNLNFIQIKGWISKLFMDDSKLIKGHMKAPMNMRDYSSYHLSGSFDNVSSESYIPEHWMIGTTVIPMDSVSSTLFVADCIAMSCDNSYNVDHIKALSKIFVKHLRLGDSVYQDCINFIKSSNKLCDLKFEDGHLRLIREFSLSVNIQREELIENLKTATL